MDRVNNSIIYVDHWGNAIRVEHECLANLELELFKEQKRKVVRNNLAKKYHAKPTKGLVDAALKAPTENY